MSPGDYIIQLDNFNGGEIWRRVTGRDGLPDPNPNGIVGLVCLGWIGRNTMFEHKVYLVHKFSGRHNRNRANRENVTITEHHRIHMLQNPSQGLRWSWSD